MSKKLFVGNLPFSMSEDKLYTLFSEQGSVSKANLITDKMTDQSRGFGFVEMPELAEAKSALEGLNGKDFKGRNLTVNEARPQTDRPRGGGGGGRRSFGGGGNRGDRGDRGGRGGGRRSW